MTNTGLVAPAALLAAVLLGASAGPVPRAEADGVAPPVASRGVPDWVLRLPAGVTRRDGVVYSVVRADTGAADASEQPDLLQAAADMAILQMLVAGADSAIAAAVDRSAAASVIRDAVMSRCVGTARLKGVDTVFSGMDGTDAVVVRSVAEEALRGAEVGVPAACDCLRSAVGSGTATPQEVMALVELQAACDGSTEDLRPALLAALGRAFGDGVSLTLQRRWVDDGARIPASGLQSWCDSARSCFGAASAPGATLAAFPASKLSEFSWSELAVALGRRMHDTSLLDAFRSRLRADGWARSAKLLEFEPVRPAAVSLRGADGSQRDLVARSVSIPAVMLLLLSDGEAPLSLASTASEGFAPAKAAFDEGTPESLGAAVSALEPGLRADPDVDSIVLMSAIMLSAGEPGIARPLAKAAHRRLPAHPYAGVNLLRAQRALGFVDEARPLVESLRSSATLDDWGRRQLADAESWLSQAR